MKRAFGSRRSYRALRFMRAKIAEQFASASWRNAPLHIDEVDASLTELRICDIRKILSQSFQCFFRYVILRIACVTTCFFEKRYRQSFLSTHVNKNPEPQVITRGSGLLFYDYFFKEFFAAVSVFCISIVIVIGPTPPGTGVIYEALGATES